MAKRIEKLDNERWKGWDWAASNKLNEVIEAVNTLTERIESLERTTSYLFTSRMNDIEAMNRSAQVEPDKILGVKVETDPRLKKDEYYFKPSEPDMSHEHVYRCQDCGKTREEVND